MDRVGLVACSGSVGTGSNHVRKAKEPRAHERTYTWPQHRVDGLEPADIRDAAWDFAGAPASSCVASALETLAGELIDIVVGPLGQPLRLYDEHWRRGRARLLRPCAPGWSSSTTRTN